MPRFAANLSFLFTELPFLERFAAAARAGFDAVEFMFPYEHSAEAVSRVATEAGVEIALFNTPPGDLAAGELGLAALPERQREFRAAVDQAISYARALACPRVHVLAGVADARDGAAIEVYCANLLHACVKASVFGIDILIEPISRRSKAGYFLNSFPMAAEIMESLKQPNLKLQFDIFHRQSLHGDVYAGLEQLLPMIGHIQVAAVPHRHEPDSGELADSRIFAFIDAIGFRGLIGAEYHPRGDTVSGLSWFAPYRRR